MPFFLKISSRPKQTCRKLHRNKTTTESKKLHRNKTTTESQNININKTTTEIQKLHRKAELQQSCKG